MVTTTITANGTNNIYSLYGYSPSYSISHDSYYGTGAKGLIVTLTFQLP